ncbi:MAG: sigma-70 family RNA polymerase sigma factor [Oscillospiraceae bacterium]|jgi:RNA polymerase sigma-70 factor (ECF subfamily)|nr:sigma-70 family RNA polymerase sigma factor [Oscillospiraceae bacterium]
MTVEELVRAAAKGRTEAFEELVRLHEKKVYALTLRMCGNPEDARDAAQEAFLSAWRGLPSFRGEAGFSTWLYRLASNAAIDQLRRNRRQREEDSLDAGEMDAPDQSPGPQEAAEGSELQRAVADGLASLSEDHRRILLLREYQQLSYDEIAQTLDMDLGTVKSRISRARRALRKILLESGNLSGYLPSKQTEKEGRS